MANVNHMRETVALSVQNLVKEILGKIPVGV
jgi:hypothetical protein